MEGCGTVNVSEASRLLGVGRTRLYAALHEGRVPALRVGRKFRIPRAVIERLLEDPAQFNRRKKR
jgi:excisionase family DNA binding protein